MKKVGEKKLYDNGWKKVVTKEFEFKNGTLKNFLITKHSNDKGAVMALALTKEEKIIYIKEYRYGPEKTIGCFPAGGEEEGLTLEENMLKELQEETGYISNEIEYLGQTISSGYDDIPIYYFIVTGCIEGKTTLEEGEYIETNTVTIDRFEELIHKGQIECAFTLSCFLLAKLKKKL